MMTSTTISSMSVKPRGGGCGRGGGSWCVMERRLVAWRGLNDNRRMSARWLTAFVIWAAVAASVVFWGLKLFVRPLPAPPQALVVEQAGGGHAAT